MHKIQGQSLEHVYISFQGHFTNGEAYVALSCATSLNGLSLSEFSNTQMCVSSVVKKEMTRLRQIQTDEPLLFKETSIDNIIFSLLNARSAKHHFPAEFAKLHMGVVVLDKKKCQSSLIFYCKIPILCQSLSKCAQMLLVISDRTDNIANSDFPDILDDPILLSADIICLTETTFYAGDNMKIDKYNCTQLPMDANSSTHVIVICVK